MRIVRFSISLFFIVLVHGAIGWFANLPQDAGEDVPSGKLMGLSFAPYQYDENPLEEEIPSPENIDKDMRLLADKTWSIRTYSSLGGLQPTPDIARKYGVKMIQGCWLSNNYKDDRKEIDALIHSANAHPDIVTRVIVGNEVLLRGEMDVDRLIGYIREVKRGVKQPVSYADVWSMYMKYPKLFKEVDFITIHILPYWEDEPISVQNAADHLEKIVKQVEDEARGIAPGKPILIGESGWPSHGRQRGMAAPGVVNEARYIRGMIQVANRHGFDYNIVEAFNQPWKASLEGVVGAYWGLFSTDRKPVFPLTGPVSENPDWLIHFIEATSLSLLIAGAYFKKMQSAPLVRLLIFLIFTQALCVCFISLAHELWYTSFSIWRQGYSVFIAAVNVLLGGLIIHRNYVILAGNPGSKRLAEGLRSIYLVFIALALYLTYGLSVNGRYLSFPVQQFLIPVVGLLGLIVCLCFSLRRLDSRTLSLDQLTGWELHTHRDRLVAYFLVIGIVALALGETKAFMDGRDFIRAHPGFSEGLPYALSYTFHNQQLLAWLLSLCVLSFPFWNNTDRKTQA